MRRLLAKFFRHESGIQTRFGFWPSRRVWLGGGVALVLLALLYGYLSLGALRALPLSEIIGFPGARDYLVILQNDAERRPTGGFISAYAVLNFRFGLPWLSFGNVYDPQLIQKGTPPPDPTVAELLAGPHYPGHGFRDGNLAPDFATSATELLRLYRLGYPQEQLHGVIALDFTAFQDLLAAVGGAGDFTAARLFSQLEEQIQGVDLHDPEQLAERKSVLGSLAKRLLLKLAVRPDLWPRAATSLATSLDTKHVLLYLADPAAEQALTTKNWAGELRAPAGSDLLAVIEGNYGGMKSSRYLLRHYDYDIELERDEQGGLVPTATLRIQLEHRGDISEPISGYYQGYFRVYAPLGSELQRGRIDREFATPSHQVFEKVVGLNPGESRDIELIYTLPRSVLSSDGVYHLDLIRQPGGAADPVRVTVKLPAGYTTSAIATTSAAQFSARESLAVWDGLLDRDRQLALQIHPDLTPPRLSQQEFTGGLGQITLRFAEPLDPDSVARANFDLSDLDYRNHSTDTLAISSVDFIAPREIRLSVTGVTPECREWYGLSFAGVADLAGNVITAGKATIVQWLDAAGNDCDPRREL